MSRPATCRLHRRRGRTTSSTLRRYYLLAWRPRTETSGADSQIPGHTPIHGRAVQPAATSRYA
eukprot:4898436-Lingulodinium_polyedra.AAC.1